MKKPEKERQGRKEREEGRERRNKRNLLVAPLTLSTEVLDVDVPGSSDGVGAAEAAEQQAIASRDSKAIQDGFVLRSPASECSHDKSHHVYIFAGELIFQVFVLLDLADGSGIEGVFVVVEGHGDVDHCDLVALQNTDVWAFPGDWVTGNVLVDKNSAVKNGGFQAILDLVVSAANGHSVGKTVAQDVGECFRVRTATPATRWGVSRAKAGECSVEGTEIESGAMDEAPVAEANPGQTQNEGRPSGCRMDQCGGTSQPSLVPAAPYTGWLDVCRFPVGVVSEGRSGSPRSRRT